MFKPRPTVITPPRKPAVPSVSRKPATLTKEEIEEYAEDTEWIRKYREALEKCRSEKDQLVRENNQLKVEKDRLVQLKASNPINCDEAVRTALEVATAKERLLTNKVSLLETQIKQQEEIWNKTKKELEAEAKEYRDYGLRLKEENDDLKHVDLLKHAAEEKNTALEKEKTELEEKIKALIAEKESLQEKPDENEMRTQINRLKDELSGKEAAIIIAANEARILAAKNEKYEATIAELENQMKSRPPADPELQTKLSTCEADKATLQTASKECETNLAEQKRENDSIAADNYRAKIEFKKLNDKLDSQIAIDEKYYKRQIAGLITSIDQLKSEIQKLNDAAETSKKVADNLEHTNSELQKSNKQKDTELAALQDKIDNNPSVDKLKADLEKAQAAYHHLSERAAALERNDSGVHIATELCFINPSLLTTVKEIQSKLAVPIF